MLIPCHTFTSLTRDEKFQPNLNTTSLTRGLNLAPTVNILNGVFFLNTAATIISTHSVARYHISSSDTLSPTFEPGFFRVKWHGEGLSTFFANRCIRTTSDHYKKNTIPIHGCCTGQVVPARMANRVRSHEGHEAARVVSGEPRGKSPFESAARFLLIAIRRSPCFRIWPGSRRESRLPRVHRKSRDGWRRWTKQS